MARAVGKRDVCRHRTVHALAKDYMDVLEGPAAYAHASGIFAFVERPGYTGRLAGTERLRQARLALRSPGLQAHRRRWGHRRLVRIISPLRLRGRRRNEKDRAVCIAHDETRHRDC